MRQGNRVFVTEDGEDVGVVPAGHEACGGDAARGGAVKLQMEGAVG